jgi:hypothetical protein
MASMLRLIGAGLVVGGCGVVAGEGGGAALPSDLQVLPLQHLQTYVLGFPIHVAVTVRAAPSVSFNRLLFPDLGDLRDTVALTLDRQDAPGQHTVTPQPVIEPEAGHFPQRLEAGETRRMLVDLSPLLPPDLPPGRYRMTLSFVTPRQSVPAPPVVLNLRAAAPAEQARREALAPDRERHATWAEWSLSCPAAAASAPQAADKKGPLGFAAELRQLMCGAGPLAQVDPAELDGLPPLYALEVEALKAELAHARRDGTAYAALRQRLLVPSVGLAWWVRAIDGGGAYVATFSRRP